jgi:hypothetical protein
MRDRPFSAELGSGNCLLKLRYHGCFGKMPAFAAYILPIDAVLGTKFTKCGWVKFLEVDLS